MFREEVIYMKTMKCNQLGGPAGCTHEFHAETWDEMAEMSKKHGMEMMDDVPHKEAMDKMTEMMNDSEAMEKWMKEKEEEFNTLAEDE